MAGLPGRYTLCWTPAPGALYLTVPANVSLAGPLEKNYACTAGVPCDMVTATGERGSVELPSLRRISPNRSDRKVGRVGD